MWCSAEPEDYYTPNLLGCSDPYFKKAELVHPLYHQEQEEKRAQEEKERRLGLRPRTEDTDDGDSKKKKKKKPLLGEEYRPPPEAQHWGALDWYLECSQLLAQRSTDGFVTAWEYLVKRDEEYIPEPNLLISLFEKKEEVWREHKRTRKGMLAVMVAGKVDRVVLDLLCRGRSSSPSISFHLLLSSPLLLPLPLTSLTPSSTSSSIPLFLYSSFS